MSATTRVVTTVTNASTKTYSYSGIDLLDSAVATLTEQIDVYLTPANTGIQVQLTATTDYTYATLPTKEITLVGSAATNLAVGDIITIKRSTKDDERYTDFTDLGFLRSEDVNTNGDQLLFLIQEARTSVQDALIKTDDLTKWQGQGLPSTNCGNAIDSTGWATLGQVTALISGGEPMDVGEGLYDTQDGDGSTTIFSLVDFPTTDINAAKLFVDISGVIQQPVTDYTYTLVAGVPTVTFSTAPPTGTDNVRFRILPGVVTTTYAAATLDGDVIITNTLDGDRIIDGTVDGDALIDQSVDVDKLDAGSGIANRFIVFNASGVGTAQAITFDNITNTGHSMPSTFTTNSVTAGGSAPPQALGTWTWTNSTGDTVFIILVTQTQNGSGTILLDSTQIASVGNSGNGLSYQTTSFFVPAGGVVTTTGTGTTKNVISFSYQEV